MKAKNERGSKKEDKKERYGEGEDGKFKIRT